MSVPVPVEQLREAVAEYGAAAFLLTGGADGRPKVASVEVAFVDGRIEVSAGEGSAANAAARPLTTLLWPPLAPGGYSLIVDAAAEVDGATIRLIPTNGVKHRPAQTGQPSGREGCAADCAPLFTSP